MAWPGVEVGAVTFPPEHSAEMRESLLNLRRRTVNLGRPERARNEGSTGSKRLDDTRCKTYGRNVPSPPETSTFTNTSSSLLSSQVLAGP